METKIITVNPREVKLLELNARFMKAEEFQLLVDNVKRDGRLTSVPFCCYTPDWELEVLSGNHRVQAAIEAGLETIEVMITEEELTNSQRVAIQLSHNSIAGQDDAAVLKELYESIDDVNYKKYSGLDDEMLKLLETVQTQSMSFPGLSFQIINLAFLPSEIAEIEKVIDDVRKEVGKNKTLTVHFADYEKYMDAMTDVSKGSGVKNTATVFLCMLEIVNRHLDEVKDMWIDRANPKEYVPISSLVGRRDMLSDDARMVNKAIERLISTGEVKKTDKEKALAVLAEKYLGVERPKKEAVSKKSKERGK